MPVNSARSGFLGLLPLAAIWLDFVWVFHLEWTLNEQYSYGWLTPLLLLYLFWMRWGSRPIPAPGSIWAWGILLCGILLLYPIRVVLWANPEWRMILWLYAGLIYALTLTVLWGIGGWRWMRYFAPAFALMLFAVPWPTFLEASIVQGLMRFVAHVVVEGMNLLGVYAEQSGNLIRLRSGWVGVEEACSGVRSLQSTLMSAWFLGELFRFRASGRFLLMVCGGAASLTLNIGRTFILTWMSHTRGTEFMEQMHDPIGHAVSVAAFFALLILALAMRTVLREPDRQRELRATHRDPAAAPRGIAILAILCLVGTHAVSWAWYHREERGLGHPDLVTLDWNRASFRPEFQEISPEIRAQLRFTDGEQAVWRPAHQQWAWTVFFFTWDTGKVSPFVGVHRPETCLPASGFAIERVHEPLKITLPNRKLAFQSMTFHLEDTRLEVFYAVWEDHPDTAGLTALTATDRLRIAWEGRRMTGKRSLQIVVRGIGHPEARRRAKAFLEQVLVSENT